MSNVLLPQRPARVTLQTAGGILCALLHLVVFWYLVHSLKDAVAVHPIIILLFPIAGVLFLALFIPIVVFLSLENDFPGLNPLNPFHYCRIFWRTYKAFVSNNWKVASKDL